MIFTTTSPNQHLFLRERRISMEQLNQEITKEDQASVRTETLHSSKPDLQVSESLEKHLPKDVPSTVGETTVPGIELIDNESEQAKSLEVEPTSAQDSPSISIVQMKENTDNDLTIIQHVPDDTLEPEPKRIKTSHDQVETTKDGIPIIVISSGENTELEDEDEEVEEEYESDYSSDEEDYFCDHDGKDASVRRINSYTKIELLTQDTRNGFSISFPKSTIL